jgi:hypothetical protein
VSDARNVIEGRFPTSDSLKLAEELLSVMPSIEHEDRDRQLIRLGLFLDEQSGLRDAVKALDDACQIINRELLPRRMKDTDPAVSVALHPAGEVTLYVTRRLSENKSSKVKAAVTTTLDVWTDVP